MKKHVRIIHTALAVALAAIFVLAFSACADKEDNQEETVEISYTVEEVYTGESEFEVTNDDDLSNTVEEVYTEESELEATTDDDLSYTVEEVYSSRDGLNIYGKLYIPKSYEDKMPAVILSHSANLNADSMNLYASGFAERGFIAYAFDFCGLGSKSRSEGSTDDMTLFSEIEDLKAVLSTVSAMDNIDADNIYLFGTSQGGLVTALVAEDCEATVKGEILLYPAFNIPELVAMAEGWGLSGLSGMFSLFGEGYSQAFSDTLKDYDVYAHIGNFSKKVLIIHGASDFIVNKSYSERAAELYGNCTLKIIDGAGHGFNKENYSMGGSYDDKVWEFIDEYLGHP